MSPQTFRFCQHPCLYIWNIIGLFSNSCVNTPVIISVQVQPHSLTCWNRKLRMMGETESGVFLLTYSLGVLFNSLLRGIISYSRKIWSLLSFLGTCLEFGFCSVSNAAIITTCCHHQLFPWVSICIPPSVLPFVPPSLAHSHKSSYFSVSCFLSPGYSLCVVLSCQHLYTWHVMAITLSSLSLSRTASTALTHCTASTG